MDKCNPCIGTEGCEIKDVVNHICYPKANVSLSKNLWTIANNLDIPLDQIQKLRKTAEKSLDIPAKETLTEILEVFVQHKTVERSYLKEFVKALEKSGCANMAHILTKSYKLQMKSFNVTSKKPLSCQKKAKYSSVASSDSNESREDVNVQSVQQNETNKKLLWIIGLLSFQLILTAIIILVLFKIYTQNEETVNVCQGKYEKFLWINVTSFREYQAQSIPLNSSQGIKLSLEIHSLENWPPESVLFSSCNIVELHLSGNIDDFILISLIRQLPSISIITIDKIDCNNSSNVYFSTDVPKELALNRLLKIRKNCLKSKVTIPINADNLKITVTSYEDYKNQVSRLPEHMFSEITLNISALTTWPNVVKDDNLSRIKKLTIIGSFSTELIVTVLKQLKEIRELTFIDSEAGLCKNMIKWDNHNYKTALVNLETLGFENFEDCYYIYELFLMHMQTDKLKYFRLQNCMVTKQNLNSIHNFLRANCQSLEELNFNLSKWDGPFLNRLYTTFPKISNIEFEFKNHQELTNFLNGLLCDDVFPILSKLVFINGYFPFDDVNIVLNCNKLKVLKMAVSIPEGMEPLSMNIFKSVLKLPPNFTLNLCFDGKSPTDICEVEPIAGINILTNCVLKEVNF